MTSLVPIFVVSAFIDLVAFAVALAVAGRRIRRKDGTGRVGSRVPRATAAGGLSRVNGVWTYVSRGVGYERGQAPPLRLLCPPEVSLLTLMAK